MEKELTQLGFSPSEIKIYLYLLKSGASYANKISKETKLNRTNIYEALDRLISKGVVSFVKRNKVKWFEAKDPNLIFTLIKTKKEELEKLENQITSKLNNFKINPINKKLEANIFIGKKGLRILFEEILETAKPIYLIASKLQFKDLFGPYFELWHKKREERKIKQRSIFPKTFQKSLKQRDLLKYRFVEGLVNPTTTIIYGDTCLLIQWSKEPIAIKIQNKEITLSHLNYFNLLWKNAFKN